jgi:hypothetical protein
VGPWSGPSASAQSTPRFSLQQMVPLSPTAKPCCEMRSKLTSLRVAAEHAEVTMKEAPDDDVRTMPPCSPTTTPR